MGAQDQIPQIEMKITEPENNTYQIVSVDLTHRCNMECANCYLPNRTYPDLKLSDFILFVNKLSKKKKVEVRFLGGEATLHPQLHEFAIETIKAGHKPSFVTNGLKLADRAYAEKLYDSGLRRVCISMNGVGDDDIYLKMDGSRCASKKLAAFKNCGELGYFVSVNVILQKGTNDLVPKKIVELFQEHKLGGLIRFKNVGQLGRHTLNFDENYKFKELLELVGKQLDIPVDYMERFRSYAGEEQEHIVFFPMNEKSRYSRKSLWIKVTDWSPSIGSVPDPNSKNRGRMTQDFKLAPFSEHIKANEFGY